MRKIKHSQLHRGPGRPPLNVKSRGISLSEADAETFKDYGFGGLSTGIRLAAALVRKTTISDEKADRRSTKRGARSDDE